MIDLATGAINFDDGLGISASTTIAQMQNVAKTSHVPSVRGRVHLNIGTHVYQDWQWVVSLIFAGDRLSQIWAQCLNAEGVDTEAWELKNEEVRRNFHDAFLLALGLSKFSVEKSISTIKYILPWGAVSSTIDIRGVQSLIVVEYF